MPGGHPSALTANVPKGKAPAKLTNPFAALKAHLESGVSAFPQQAAQPQESPELDLSAYNVPGMGAEGYSVQGKVKVEQRDDPRFDKENRTATVMAARKRRPMLAAGFDENAPPITAPPSLPAHTEETGAQPKEAAEPERQLSLFDTAGEPIDLEAQKARAAHAAGAQTQDGAQHEGAEENRVSLADGRKGDTQDGTGEPPPSTGLQVPAILFQTGPSGPTFPPSTGGTQSNPESKKSLPILGQHPPRKASATEYSELQEADIAAVLDLTGVACNSCPLFDGKCEHAKEDALCFYERSLEGLSSRDMENLVPSLELVADLQNKRARRGAMIEARSSGGLLDPGVTRQLEVAAAATLRVQEVKARLAGPPPGQQTTTSFALVAQQTGPQQGGGLLSKLLAGFSPPPLPEGAPREAPKPVEVLTVGEEAV